MNRNYYIKETCRLCKSKQLNKVVRLEPTPLCDQYLSKKEDQALYPLNLYQCDACKFCQIDCIIDPELIYKDYIYVSKSSSDLKNHFESYVKNVIEYTHIKRNDFVIDIGSNDGLLLTVFKENGQRILGVEPSSEIAQEANDNGIHTLSEYFTLNLAKKIKTKYGSADLVTVNNVFANIDDLENFTLGVVELLSNEGILVIEASYLLDMVNNMVFDYIYHEHLSYFSLMPLKIFFERLDLKLIHVERIPTKGGSIRIYCAKKSSNRTENNSVNLFLSNENSAHINQDFFRAFTKRINALKIALKETLAKNPTKKIIGYGASATSTTLIYYFDIHNDIKLLLDDNPRKIGTYSPGSHIPVQALKDTAIDENVIIIILGWRFSEEILKRLKHYQCTIIIPLPEFKIINHQ